jgi:hypothetical protein
LLTLIALKYLASSSLTFGNKKNKPIKLGTAMAKIMASEKSVTAPRLAAEPTITNKQNKTL